MLNSCREVLIHSIRCVCVGAYCVHREWDYFNISKPCPYQFTAEELQKHSKEVESFNKSQELWAGLKGILTDEGYASNESYTKAVEVLKDLREVGLDGLEGEEKRTFDKHTSWVANLDVESR